MATTTLLKLPEVAAMTGLPAGDAEIHAHHGLRPTLSAHRATGDVHGE